MMKKLIAETLKKVSEKMTTSVTASYVSVGVENMPESMKKLR